MFWLHIVLWVLISNKLIIDTESSQLLGSYDVHNFDELGDKLCLERWQRQINFRGRDVKDPIWNTPMYLKALNVNRSNVFKNLLVHVGKTAGGTITKMLRDHHVLFQELHVHSLDSIMVDDFNTIILSLRDPVQRLISAYHYNNPLIPTSSAKLQNIHVEEFYACNPDLTTFADNLVLPTKCGAIARNISENTSFGKSHLTLDTCAYIRGVFDNLKDHREKVHIVNQESLVEDLNKISTKKMWNVTFINPPHVHDIKMAVQISPLSYIKLAGYLELTGESRFYHKVQREFGVDLPPPRYRRQS